MTREVHHHTFDNGLTLVAEPMEHVRSAAFNFLVVSGCAYDPADQLGMASVLADLVVRGAGERDSRALTLALDNLGVDRDETAGIIHTRFWGATLASNLPAALEVYADILRRPRLPQDDLEAVQMLALQDLEALEDEPRHKVLVELRKHHFRPPLGRDRRGTPEGIRRLSHESIRKHYQRYYQPAGAILAVAGQIDWQPLVEHVGRLFGDWQANPVPELELGPPPPKRAHLDKDTQQTQIAVAFDSVPFGHPDYYAAMGTVNVLSGGMSARLFDRIREKQGLCYAIWATYQTFKNHAAILCYAGTTNERARATLDLLLAELEKLEQGIEPDEVARVQAGLKSSLIMQQESVSSRAGSIASDWYYLGRVRSLDEIQSAIDSLTPETLVDYVRRVPPRDYTIVTLGPKPL